MFGAGKILDGFPFSAESILGFGPSHPQGGMGDMEQSGWDLCSVFSLWKLLEPHEVCAVILLLQMKHPVVRGVEPPA